MAARWPEKLLELGRVQRGEPLRLGLRNLYIVPSRFGWLWLAGTALLQLVAIQLRANGPLLLSFLLLGLFLLSLHLTHANLQGLELAAVDPPAAFADGPVAYPLLLRCRGRCEGLRLVLPGEPPGPILNLAAGQHRLVLPWRPARRGLATPGVVRLQTTAPLGLWLCWSRWQLPRPQLIYPARRVGPLRQRPCASAPDSESGTRHARREGSETWEELRPHRPEDTPSRLAWKLFAQGRGSFSKRFRDPEPRALALAPDPALPLERALEHVCERLCRLQHAGVPYALEAPGGLIGPDRGLAHRDRCLAALARWPRP